jgi:hypothetical protein
MINVNEPIPTLPACWSPAFRVSPEIIEYALAVTAKWLHDARREKLCSPPNSCTDAQPPRHRRGL